MFGYSGMFRGIESTSFGHLPEESSLQERLEVPFRYDLLYFLLC